MTTFLKIKWDSLKVRLNSHCEAQIYKKKKKKTESIQESCLERA